MTILAAIAGVGLMLLILLDAFETIILPRRVSRRFRLTSFFYRSTWRPWLGAARLFPQTKRREAYLSIYGPLSLLWLLTFWAFGLVLSFGLLDWATGSQVRVSDGAPGFLMDLYLSGTTFFTLGIGDVTPHTSFARVFTVLEAGIGFGFLAIVIGYLPVIYQAFSRREVSISLLDARAGSPPTAAELMRRHAHTHGMEELRELLKDWERWSADLLESHLSYPPLAYFRSQHSNQSWLTALATILDASALVIAGVEGACRRQAELTFAIARHAAVDLAQIFATPPSRPVPNRLSVADVSILRARLGDAGVILHDGDGFADRLTQLQNMYEPYIHALSSYLNISLPPWMVEKARADNWQTSGWDKLLQKQSQGDPAVSCKIPVLGELRREYPAREEHF